MINPTTLYEYINLSLSMEEKTIKRKWRKTIITIENNYRKNSH